MTSTVTSPSGRVLQMRATVQTTPQEDSAAKIVRIQPDLDEERKKRLAENRENLKNANVQAFLKAIAFAEGGAYDFKFGAIKGKKNDPWRFTDFSTHPGAGLNGKTAAGMYQITQETWRDHGGAAMGLTDFTPETQDLIAANMLRRAGVIEKIKAGEIATSMLPAAKKWAALPEGPGKGNHYPPQPYISYESFIGKYKELGGTVK
ncbi:paar repeat-containing protein [Massilia sp. TS11]|uniref:paar repeat-containing protein n=1 Tax=Massilia sp. TS11 TaxID=2908003 RepID=UPI001EDB444B|nr:paar repeat-containing protein [Massilia sp. TS11]MCG2583062.1 paar repeat-containing protein [Massilia sp. TS11]